MGCACERPRRTAAPVAGAGALRGGAGAGLLPAPSGGVVWWVWRRV